MNDTQILASRTATIPMTVLAVCYNSARSNAVALPALQEREATLDDLYQHTNKAELLHGTVVPLMPTRRAPSYAAFEIAVSLRQHIRSAGLPGVAVTDNAGFVVNLPHRSYLGRRSAWRRSHRPQVHPNQRSHNSQRHLHPWPKRRCSARPWMAHACRRSF